MCISQQNNVYPPKKGGDTYTCVLSLIHIHTHPFSYLGLGHVYDVYIPHHTHDVYDHVYDGEGWRRDNPVQHGEKE